MLRKSLATLVIAGSLLATNAAMVSAHSDENRGLEKAKIKAEVSSSAAIDLACMATAIDVREAAVATALDTYHANIKTALQTRRAALKAAYSITDAKARKDAIKAAWETFSGTWRKNAKDLKTARRAAWNTFNTERKECNGQAESNMNMGIDMKL